MIKNVINKYMTNHTVTDTAVTCNNKIYDKKNNVTCHTGFCVTAYTQNILIHKTHENN